jgi:hypothetical protein
MNVEGRNGRMEGWNSVGNRGAILFIVCSSEFRKTKNRKSRILNREQGIIYSGFIRIDFSLGLSYYFLQTVNCKLSGYLILLFVLIGSLMPLQGQVTENDSIPTEQSVEQEPIPVSLPILRKPFSAEIYNFSGDQQTQNIGLRTENPIRVQVVTPEGLACAGLPGFFRGALHTGEGEEFLTCRTRWFTPTAWELPGCMRQ